MNTMSKILHLIILIHILIPISAASAQDFTNETTIPGTYEGLSVEFYLATDKETYVASDTIWMTYSVTNTGHQSIAFNMSAIFWLCQYIVYDGHEDMTWLYPEGTLPVVWGFMLEPQETMADTAFWWTDTIDGDMVNPYTLTAELDTWEEVSPRSIGLQFNFMETDVENSIEQRVPSEFLLFQNYPNPFNAKTSITYQIPKSGRVTLDIYNIYGSLVTTLVNDYMPEGTHSVVWDAKGLSSGVYFYRMTIDQFSTVRKCVLLR